MAGQQVVRKEQCPKCAERGEDSSGDNLAVYDDGHAYCFSCGHYRFPDGETPPDAEVEDNESFSPVMGKYQRLIKRFIEEETCRKWGYQVGHLNGRKCHIANYFDEDKKVVAQKIRFKGKDFLIRGNAKAMGLWGKQLWKPHPKKRIVVTEGEIDALSVSQIQSNQWPVVSVPNGAAAAKKVFQKELEYLNGFKQVIIAFDSDKAGIEAAKECAALFAPGKAHIALFELEDPNDYLKVGRDDDLARALWDAREYRPDGVIHASEIEVDKEESVREIWDYPWDAMTSALFGRRSGELVIHTSGSGMGKTTVMRQMINFDVANGDTVGVLMLEEGKEDTLNELISLRLKKPVRKIMAARKVNSARVARGMEPLEFGVKDDLTDDEYMEAYNYYANSNLYLFDHFGSSDADTIISKMDYMVNGWGCKKLYLDHLSIIVSGQETNDERKEIDLMMTKLREFVERTDCHVDAVCHLRTPKGTPFEEGGQVSLNSLRGSRSLGQLSDSCIGYERNQQDPDPVRANTIIVRSVKDRFGGNLGVIAALRYNKETTELESIPFQLDDDGAPDFLDDVFEDEDTTEDNLLDD